MNVELMTRPELDPTWTALSFDERKEVELWLKLVRRIEMAVDKCAEIAAICREHGHLRGVSKSALYRKRAAFRRSGVAGLVRRYRRVRGSEVGLPADFVQWLHGRCGLHQRAKFAAVYRSLFVEWLCAGRTIPGYDADWRGIWSREHGRAAPEDCPYRAYDCTPKGWSYRQLLRHCPDEDVWAAAAQGPWAASAHLPKVPHTRVGLELGQIYVIDDVQHDFKVNFPGQLEAQRPVELGALELLTGHYASYGLCPVRLRVDGSREMLTENYVRYLLVDILCRIGVHPDGVLILAEHGTAAIRGELLGRIHAITGEAGFRVEAGNCFGAPLVAGLLAARPRGNPRWKAALEAHHNLKHNELAMLPGQIGMDRDHAPEDVPARDRENKALTAACLSLARQRPDLAAAMARPYVAWPTFCQAITDIYRRVSYRREHALEGYAECGFTAQEFRLDESLPWLAMDKLDAMPGPARATALALIEGRRGLARCRLLSPAEAWDVAARRVQLKRYPMSAAAHILGPELGQRRKVAKDGTLELSVEGQRKTARYLAIARDDRGCDIRLEAGAAVLCWVNPINYQQALCAHPDGRWIGVLPAMIATTHGDREAEKRNLGLREKAVAERLKRLGPVLDAQLDRRMEAAEINAGLLLDDDPVEEALQADADAQRMRAHVRQSRRDCDAGLDVDLDGDADGDLGVDLGVDADVVWLEDEPAGVSIEELESLCATR